jgi:hypothetical protein
MLNRTALLLVAGAAIFTLDASSASAQDTTKTKPRSQRRIPITKESPGEVVSPRVDTMTVYRTDTLRLLGRTDTVNITNTNTIVRVDTVTQMVPMTARHIGGLYLGVAGGGALPFGAIRTVNEPGWLGQAQLGYQGIGNPLGIRADLSMTQYSHSADYAFFGDRPKVWNANLDAKLELPFFNSTLGSSVQFKPYLIGGGSYLRYSMLRMKLDTDGGATGGFGAQNAVIAGADGGTSQSDYHSNFGWNAGGGISFHAGRKEMFIEARAVHFTNGEQQFGSSWHVPVVFGVNLF